MSEMNDDDVFVTKLVGLLAIALLFATLLAGVVKEMTERGCEPRPPVAPTVGRR